MNDEVEDRPEDLQLRQKLSTLTPDEVARYERSVKVAQDSGLQLDAKHRLAIASTVLKGLSPTLEITEIEQTRRLAYTEQHYRENRERLEANRAQARTSPQQQDLAAQERGKPPDYFAKNANRADSKEPRDQWLGKYATLDELSRKGQNQGASPEGLHRQQREDSDRRQTSPVEHHDKLAREAKDPNYRHTSAERTEREIGTTRRFTPPGADRPNNQSNSHGRGGGRSRGR